ncbi:MAG TPA: hypothetical protein VHI13_21935 [Candidatus Kapabacteria bacterium]|nr:hypothetical protein [Candidatus Kapabacteria bacterium]
MRNGICPKCASETVHLVEAYRLADHNIPITRWNSAGLDYYVCVTCGFVESYVHDGKELAALAAVRPRVTPD